MAGAFDALRVVEIASGIAGPYAAMLLAEQGADVLKLEPPGGERFRREGVPGFYVWNRSKHSAIADWATDEGRRLAAELLLRCDVAIVDLPESEARVLGIDSPRVLAQAPHVVYCHMPPFGSRGPLANGTTSESLLDAYAGVHGGQAAARPGPVYVLQPFGAQGAAFLAAQAIAAALYERERSGRGQRVEVSWLAGAFAMQTASIVWSPQVQYLLTAARNPQGAMPTYRLYEAGDGLWLFIACGNPVFYQRLLMDLGLAELLADERYTHGPWGLASPEAREELTAKIAPIIATRPRAEWLGQFEAADIPCAPVETREDFIEDEQVAANGMRAVLADPKVGRTVQMGTPVRLASTTGVRGPAPALGAHQAQAESRARGEPRPALPAPTRAEREGGPLAGLRVVDFSSYIAGPLCPMMLSDLGADVIKVEPLGGDAFRALAIGFMGWNRGKRSIAVDLRSEPGRAIARKLVESADVLVENFRPGVAERLGLDEATIREIRPEIIYCAVRGHGSTGPRADRPAFDPLLQARSGIMPAQGGDGPPVFHTVAMSDYTAALLAAYGVCAALVERARTGRGGRVETSLTNAAMAAQSGSFVFYEGRAQERRGGPDLLGTCLANRLWQAADERWLLVDAREAVAWEGFARILGAGLAHTEAVTLPADAPQAAAIEAAFREANADAWLTRFRHAGVPCSMVLGVAELLQDEQVAANELLAEFPHKVWGTIRQTGVLPKFERTPGVARRVAPLLGEHTVELLAELGYEPEAIQRLLEAGAVAGET